MRLVCLGQVASGLLLERRKGMVFVRGFFSKISSRGFHGSRGFHVLLQILEFVVLERALFSGLRGCHGFQYVENEPLPS